MNKNLKSVCFFSLVFLFVDQIIKIFLNNQMVLYQSNILIKNILSLTLVHNTGAAFSIFTGSRIFLIMIGILATVGIILYVVKNDSSDGYDLFTYSLLLGGVLGNLLDRIIYGYVIDYISFSAFNYAFPIFNFADMCIVLSVILIIIKTIRVDVWKN